MSLLDGLPDTEPITPLSAEDGGGYTTSDPAPEFVCQSPGCGTELVYAGRGAKPKWCPTHKGGKGAGGTGTRPVSSGGRPSKDERLRRGLVQQLNMIGVMLVAVDPYDSMVVLDKTEETVDAFMAAAETNPKLKAALESLLVVSAWSAVAAAITGMALPILIHHNVIPIPADMIEPMFISAETLASMDAMGLRSRKPSLNVVSPLHGSSDEV